VPSLLYCTFINSSSLRVAWLATSMPSPAHLAGLATRVSPLKYFRLCVKCCPVNVRVTSLISDTLNAFGPHCGSRTLQLPFTSELTPVLLSQQTIPGCGAYCAPVSNCLILFRPPPSLIVACAIICACRRLPPGKLPWPRTLLRTTFLPGGVGGDLALQPTSTLSGAPLTCAHPPLPLLNFGPAVVFPFLCVLSGKLSYCHSVDWDSVPVHGLCPRPNCEVPITMPPLGTAGGYTFIERRWRCFQHCLFSCKASPRGCPEPTDLWADLWDLLPHESPSRERVCLALHVDSFDADSVFAHCLSWLLDPFSFLQGCSRTRRRVMLCAPLLPPLFFLIGASVADDGVPAGSRVFASELVRRSLSALALPRVAGRCPLPFRPARGAEA
jgi:hypothetical protein